MNNFYSRQKILEKTMLKSSITNFGKALPKHMGASASSAGSAAPAIKAQKMRQVDLATDMTTDMQKSYMKEWNDHYFIKNMNKKGVVMRKRYIGGLLFGIVAGIYYMALNRFKFHGDDLIGEMDTEYARGLLESWLG